MFFTLKTLLHYKILQTDNDDFKTGIKIIKEHIVFTSFLFVCNIILNSLIIYFIDKKYELEHMFLQLLCYDLLLSIFIDLYVMSISYTSTEDKSFIKIILIYFLTVVILNLLYLKKFDKAPLCIKIDMILTIICFVCFLIYSFYYKKNVNITNDYQLV